MARSSTRTSRLDGSARRSYTEDSQAILRVPPQNFPGRIDPSRLDNPAVRFPVRFSGRAFSSMGRMSRRIAGSFDRGSDMAKGLALTIGLNAVDPRHYEGWSGKLNACEADARDMADIARSRKFKVQRLLTRRATRSAVLGGIARAASALRSGDIFLLTYSGHGGQVPDRNMPREVALRTYRAHRGMYDKLQDSSKSDPRAAVRASVILISGCQDNQLSQDGDFNGLFTANLLRV